MEREKVMGIVEPLFREKGCVDRDELLERIDASPGLDPEEKRVLHSMGDSKCYTKDEFADVLSSYGPDAPIGYGAGRGGF